MTRPHAPSRPNFGVRKSARERLNPYAANPRLTTRSRSFPKPAEEAGGDIAIESAPGSCGQGRSPALKRVPCISDRPTRERMNNPTPDRAIQARADSPASVPAPARLPLAKIPAVLALLASSCSALAEDNKLELGLWAGPGAGSLAEVSEVYEHHACAGEVARVLMPRLPIAWDGSVPLEPEQVEELSHEGDTIHVWPMPVDMHVAGVDGESIYVRPFSLDDADALRIELDGAYKAESFPGTILDARPLPSPAGAAAVDSDYIRCLLFRDRTTGEPRLLRYQGPCT